MAISNPFCRLPQIQEELERSINVTRNHLSKLPQEPSSDPRSEILTLLHVFTTDLAAHVSGLPDDPNSETGMGLTGLIQGIRPLQERFRLSIRATAPNFIPFEKKYKTERYLPPPAFLMVEEGDECEDGLNEPDTKSVNSNSSFAEDLSMRKTRKVLGSLTRIYIDEVLEKAHRYVIF